MNIFGSSLFNLGFNQMWEADGFSPYIVMGPAAAGAAEEDSEDSKKGEGEVFKLKAGGAKAKRKSAWEVDDLQLGSKEVEENDGDDSSGITLKMRIYKRSLQDKTSLTLYTAGSRICSTLKLEQAFHADHREHQHFVVHPRRKMQANVSSRSILLRQRKIRV